MAAGGSFLEELLALFMWFPDFKGNLEIAVVVDIVDLLHLPSYFPHILPSQCIYST